MDVLAGMDSKDKSKLTTTTIKPEEEIGEVMKHPECGCDIHVGIGTRFPLTDELDLPFDDQITCSRVTFLHFCFHAIMNSCCYFSLQA